MQLRRASKRTTVRKWLRWGLGALGSIVCAPALATTLWLTAAQQIYTVDTLANRAAFVAAVPAVRALAPTASGGAWVATEAALREFDAAGEPIPSATLSTSRPTFTLGMDALCSGVPCGPPLSFAESFTLSVELDQHDVSGELHFARDTGHATFTPGAPLSVGTHTFRASATDAFGHVSNRINAPFAIAAVGAELKGKPNQAPAVILTAPANNATFNAGTNIAISATASDPDGSISKVDFYRSGSILLGTATASPYGITWSNIPGGSYSLTAKATDNGGAATTSSVVNITVVANQAPSAAITSPASGSVYAAPGSVAIAATAADADGTLVKVEFYQGTALLGTVTSAPYTFTWSNVPAGSYNLTVKATDNQGATTTSAAVLLRVTAPPLVVLKQPAACIAFTAPAAFTLNADAVDVDGWIANVAFYLGSTLVGSVTRTPYTLSLTNVSAGIYSLTARATDNLGVSSVSAPVTISVAPPDNPPAVTLTSPSAGATFAVGSPINLAASASDSDGSVMKVDFYAGATLVASASAAPYSATWSSSSAGSVSLTAKATDNAGAATTSAPVNVTVVANAAPSVALTAPSAGATYVAPASVALAATASDSDGSVTRVDFYADATLIGTASAAPYSATWVNAPAGSYALSARATDNLGTTTASPPVTITIDASPAATLTAPADGSVYAAPATVAISVNASDTDGTLSKLELFRNGISLAVATPPPGSSTFSYNFTWSGLAAGNYALTAQATDNQGALGTSSAVNIVVMPPPSVTLTAPADGSRFLAPAMIDLAASATATSGSISRVDFYQGATLLGTATTAPYTLAWNGVPAGSYALSARATDNRGGMATSPVANVTVLNDAPPSVALSAPTNGTAYFAPATINLAAGASDSDGTITQVEFYQGGTLLGAAMSAPYAFAWSNVAAGRYTLTAKATDNAGASTTSAAVAVTVSAPGFAITNPGDGATIDGDGVVVSGTVNAPANSGVTVNGVVAAIDSNGQFYANGVPLAVGANTLTATLTTQEGQTDTQAITVTSAGPKPWKIGATPTQGLSPLTVSFALSTQAAVEIQSLTYSFAITGNVTPSVGPIDPMAVTFTFSGVGTVAATVTFIDTQSNQYRQTIPIVLLDSAQLDQTLRALWSGMTSALAAGDKATAMKYLSPPAQRIYGPVFDALAADLPQIIPSWSSPLKGSLSDSLAEYGVVTTGTGTRQLFLIYFLKGADGVWRLESM